MRNKKTFTKKAVMFALILGAVGGFTPFFLSLLGKESVEALGIAWVTEVFAVIVTYCAKAYFETKQERKQQLENYINGMEGEDERSDCE